MIKRIDCFIDDYGFVNKDHVDFSMKNKNLFLLFHLFSLICLQNYPTFQKRKKLTVTK